MGLGVDAYLYCKKKPKQKTKTPFRMTRENYSDNCNAASELKEPGRPTEVYTKIKGTGRISIT